MCGPGDGARIVEAACWAHTRRKFHDIYAATQSPTAAEAIRRIGELYAVEKQVRGSHHRSGSPPGKSAPRRPSKELKRSPEQTLQTLSIKSGMAGAIRYALLRWAALADYLDDGTVEIDNNAAERALRIVALLRKNYFSLDRTEW